MLTAPILISPRAEFRLYGGLLLTFRASGERHSIDLFENNQSRKSNRKATHYKTTFELGQKIFEDNRGSRGVLGFYILWATENAEIVRGIHEVQNHILELSFSGIARDLALATEMLEKACALVSSKQVIPGDIRQAADEHHQLFSLMPPDQVPESLSGWFRAMSSGKQPEQERSVLPLLLIRGQVLDYA